MIEAKLWTLEEEVVFLRKQTAWLIDELIMKSICPGTWTRESCVGVFGRTPRPETCIKCWMIKSAEGLEFFEEGL